MSRNAHWYSLNEGISYPVDEGVTLLAEGTGLLPSNILVDLMVRWPETLGKYAFLSSLSVTPGLVSLTIQAADGPDSSSSFVPLAVLAVPRPAAQGRQYPLLPQAEGVGGWAAFGAGVEEEWRGRFASPAASRLAARAARPYPPLPIPSLRCVGAASGLAGVVSLSALPPLAIAAEQREIGGVLRDCVVVRLVDDRGIDGFPVPAAAAAIGGYSDPSLFAAYAGPCAGRPESGTCGDPVPIQFVNAVGPDCAGTVTIRFDGCASLSQVSGTCGAVVDCNLGLADACLPPRIPDSAGILPDEYTPTVVPAPTPSPTPTPTPTGASLSLSSSRPAASLPFSECFYGATAPGLVPAVGSWWFPPGNFDPYRPCADSDSLNARDLYNYATMSAAGRNVSLLSIDNTTVGRTFEAHVQMSPGPAGALHNAAVVVNYRPHSTIDGQHVYYLVEVDYDSQSFRIARFNGTVFQTAASVEVPGIQVGYRYGLAATVEQTPTPGQVSITGHLRGLDSPGLSVQLGPLAVANYLPADGRFGLGTNRAYSTFTYIALDRS